MRGPARADIGHELKIDLAHLAGLIVPDGLMDLVFRVHDEGPIADHGFIEGHARQQQEFQRLFASSPVRDASHLCPVVAEDDHLMRTRAFLPSAPNSPAPISRRRRRCSSPARADLSAARLQGHVQESDGGDGCRWRRSCPGTHPPRSSPSLCRRRSSPPGCRCWATPGSGASSACPCGAGSPRSGSRASGRPCRRNASSGISECTTPAPAVIHCTSPGPMEPAWPWESLCCILPSST